MTAPAVAALERFSYAYPGWVDEPVAVLRDVDLDLGPGLTLVAGDSGSGKSTLLRVLNGLVPHFHGGRVSGRAAVCGMDVLATPTRRLARHVGFVFQEVDAGFVRGTVAREVAFGPENLGTDPALVRRQVAEALERVGIASLARRRLRTLSGGERQRVALAAALVSSPAVVVMDEPTSQLDEAGTHDLAAGVAEAVAEGRCIVVAEHRLGRFSGAEHMLLVEDGTVRTAAPPVSEPSRSSVVGAPKEMVCGPPAWSLEAAAIGIEGRALAEGIDVSGSSGEVVIVHGANGAGKTTLLRTIAGLLPTLSGRAERRHGRVAYLPQDPGVLLHRQSVRAEIEQTLRWTGSTDSPTRILRLLGLEALAEHDPRDLSVGQRQRAALAAVLAGHPAVALLDEPTRGMDRAARHALAATVQHLADDGAAVVLATHDVELARELPGRVLRIAEGAVRPDAAEPVR